MTRRAAGAGRRPNCSAAASKAGPIAVSPCELRPLARTAAAKARALSASATRLPIDRHPDFVGVRPFEHQDLDAARDGAGRVDEPRVGEGAGDAVMLQKIGVGADARRDVDGENERQPRCLRRHQRWAAQRDRQRDPQERPEHAREAYRAGLFGRYKRAGSRYGEGAVKSIFVIAIGLALGVSAAAAFGASKHAAQKGPPPCSALTFRAVASGAADGDQQAGFYRSRYGTLALHADVKDGKPTDYFVLADGKRLTAAPAALPDWAASCAVAKKLPKPAAAGARRVHRRALQGGPRP